jgi:hypothetical protein
VTTTCEGEVDGDGGCLGQPAWISPLWMYLWWMVTYYIYFTYYNNMLLWTGGTGYHTSVVCVGLMTVEWWIVVVVRSQQLTAPALMSVLLSIFFNFKF